MATDGPKSTSVPSSLMDGESARTSLPLTDLEKTLFSIDELTGLVGAAALVRPSRIILDLPVKSVLKKWKDKAFAGGVNRAVIEKGAAMLGLPLDELIADTIEGMMPVAEKIGLKGNL